MDDFIDDLKSLHTALVDSRNGYQEALEDAEGKGLTPLFRDMIKLRNDHIAQLAKHITARGEDVDQDGSFMTTVHRTVISIRSALTGLDESILPALIDGEKRIRGYYEDAIKAAPGASPVTETLRSQIATLDGKVREMESRKAAA